MPLLQEKTGSAQTTRRFRQEIKAICDRDPLPDYRLFIDESVKPNKLVVMTRDGRKLINEANKTDKLAWLGRFLQKKIL